jgi:hypothetical protein
VDGSVGKLSPSTPLRSCPGIRAAGDYTKSGRAGNGAKAKRRQRTMSSIALERMHILA